MWLEEELGGHGGQGRAVSSGVSQPQIPEGAPCASGD